MIHSHAGPPRYRPTPLESVDLIVHPQRRRPPAIDQGERYLVALFLQRLTIWYARRRDIDGVHGSTALLVELVH